ncbi:MAG: class I SAM-dependent methyltransferase [Anaerolineae bacterium]
MSSRQDVVWKTEALAHTFLEGVRGGIPFAAEQIDVMLQIIRARGEPVERFVDLGCGDGILSRALLSQYPAARGTLVDFSEPMLDAARAKTSKPGQITFVLADLGTSDWVNSAQQNGPVDAVISGFAIHHLPHTLKRALYRQIFELVRPSGIFINIEHVASPSAWVGALADDLLIDSLYAYHHRNGASTSRAQVADEFVHRPDKVANILAPVEMQCEWLRAIGFQDVDCYFKVFELAVFGGRRP